ncbi:MAG: glycosyl transferase [Acidimicrobiales bacterium]|nr:glycosyl transferase [Acidimicrobiales bacterium]
MAWCGYPEPLTELLPPGAKFLPVGPEVPPSLARAARESVGLRGPMALKFLWEGFIVPLARAMVPGVARAVEAFEPDVVVVDQQAPAGAIVARQAGAAWVTSATTSAELVDPFAGLPKVANWIAGLLQELEQAHGVAPGGMARDLRFSDQLLLAFTSKALVGEHAGFPSHWAFVGPAVDGRPEEVPFPYDALCPDVPKILVSLGTVNAEAGTRFFGQVVEALGRLPVQGIVVAPPELIGDIPPNVLVFPRVPQLALLPHIDVVVCHGGHNTVCEALAHGVPLVMAPIRDDQPIVADQVVRAGAGKRLRFGRVQSDDLARAIVALLDEPRYRERARRIQQSFRTAGGAPAAADRLEELVA